jgi:hypothetical protein
MGNFADKVVVRFGKGKGSQEPAPAAPADADDAGDAKPGSKGKMLAAALKKGDGEAIEEAVLAITGG